MVEKDGRRERFEDLLEAAGYSLAVKQYVFADQTLREIMGVKDCFLLFRRAGAGSFRVSETVSDDGIPALGVGDILSDFSVSRIDVLKIDIEGPEVEVLGRSDHWLDHVRTLIIELHDRFRPGCPAALEKALRGRDYRGSTSGESTAITDLRRTAA